VHVRSFDHRDDVTEEFATRRVSTQTSNVRLFAVCIYTVSGIPVYQHVDRRELFSGRPIAFTKGCTVVRAITPDHGGRPRWHERPRTARHCVTVDARWLYRHRFNKYWQINWWTRWSWRGRCMIDESRIDHSDSLLIETYIEWLARRCRTVCERNTLNAAPELYTVLWIAASNGVVRETMEIIEMGWCCAFEYYVWKP